MMVLNRQSVEASLEKVPAFAPEPIEPRRHRAEQPMHAHGQVWFGRHDDQVKVVSQQNIRLQLLAIARDRLHQSCHERLSRPSTLEDIPTVIPTIDP